MDVSRRPVVPSARFTRLHQLHAALPTPSRATPPRFLQRHQKAKRRILELSMSPTLRPCGARLREGLTSGRPRGNRNARTSMSVMVRTPVRPAEAIIGYSAEVKYPFN